MKIFFFLALLSLSQTQGNRWGERSGLYSRCFIQNHTFYIPKYCKHNLPADGWLLKFLATGDVGRFQSILWALLSGS
jgi:hypothetical protein